MKIKEEITNDLIKIKRKVKDYYRQLDNLNVK